VAATAGQRILHLPRGIRRSRPGPGPRTPVRYRPESRGGTEGAL